MSNVSSSLESSPYDAEYYRTGLGVPYERSAHWLNFFGHIANEVIRSLKPATVLDVGCAFGFLVESFWDRGVASFGIEISDFALSQVRRDMQPYCRLGSILDPIEDRYDLVTCIEVLEHLLPEQTAGAITNLTAASDTILFSSTPTDLNEPTHFNVRPIIGWLDLFAKHGFSPDCAYDASFVAPQAILLRKQAPLSRETSILFSEHLRLKCAFGEREARIGSLNQEIVARDQQIAGRNQQVTELLARASELALREEENQRKSSELASLYEQACKANSALEHQLQEVRQNHAAALEQITASGRREKETENRSQLSLSALGSELTAQRQKFETVRRKLFLLKNLFHSVSLEAARLEATKTLVPWKKTARQFLNEVRLAVTLRRRTWREKHHRFLRDVDLIGGSGFFDSDWYLENYPDVAAADENPILHYARNGGAEDRNPGPKFDALWYREHYPDIAAGRLNPLIHYLEFGMAEAREIRAADERYVAEVEEQRHVDLIAGSSLFDPDWYLKTYPDVADAKVDPLLHYLRSGAAENRNPSPHFDARWYLDRYPDVAAAGSNPLIHYLQFGLPEGRETRPVVSRSSFYELIASSDLFDAEWYLQNHPEIATSKSDPIDHYLQNGASKPLDPGPKFDAAWYMRQNPDVAAAGLNPLVHYLEHGIREGRSIRPALYTPDIEEVLQHQFPALAPLATFPVPELGNRITIVTDSINSGSLYGGVGTALILATCLAKEVNARLRLVTRTAQPNADNFHHVLSVNGIEWEEDIEFVYAPLDGSRSVGVSANDVFMTTSWWTTTSVRKAVPPSKIFYLLQEDERMFYPFGDERLRCEEALADPEIRFVVNSELLFNHLTNAANGLDSIRSRAVWFEPAFPEWNFHPEQPGHSGGKKRFLVYARPKNLRNLYWRGLETIGACIRNGILRPDEWEFYFVGHSIENVALPGGAIPIIVENLPWAEYAKLTRQMDAALCLMDTPHPSYPPLDLAASGAVVVTNQHGIKSSLARYSENIICSEPTVEGLMEGIKRAVAIVGDDGLRSSNYMRNGLNRDWNSALCPVVKRLAVFISADQA